MNPVKENAPGTTPDAVFESDSKTNLSPVGTVSRLSLSEISTQGGTQIRAKIDIETVDAYANAMLDGDKFPPVVVFHDGNRYIMADGFHRILAMTRNGGKEIEADVHKGTKSDALRYALGANSTHGKPRTNMDKRRSAMLALEEWPKLSDRELAKICAVHHDLVADVRKTQLADSASSSEPEPRIGADGKSRRMPKKHTEAPAPAPEPEPEPDDEPPRVKSADEEMAALDVSSTTQISTANKSTHQIEAERWWGHEAEPRQRGDFIQELIESHRRVRVESHRKFRKRVLLWLDYDVVGKKHMSTTAGKPNATQE